MSNTAGKVSSLGAAIEPAKSVPASLQKNTPLRTTHLSYERGDFDSRSHG